MNSAPRLLLPLVLIPGLSLSTIAAQDPAKAPPWWRVQDDVTVSLYWSFDAPFAPGTFPPPTLVVAPQWYNPAVTQGVVTGNLQRLPSLAGHVGVLGLQPSGSPQSATLDLTVDNDPYPDWIKIFWFQFEAFEGSTGSIKAAIEQDLAKYRRSSVTVSSEPGSLPGWERVTIEAQLIPQPDDEGIDWTFLENGAAIGIDDLYVNSKCVKPGADEKGDALGKVDGFAIDLTAATLGRDCQAVAVTEGPAPLFQRSYWVSTRAQLPGGFHEIIRLNQVGTPTGTTILPDTTASAPGGASDLAVETVTLTPTTSQQFLYVLVDRRPSGGNVVLQALDTAGSLATSRNLILLGFPPLAQVPPQDLGLAFEPSGDRGNGTFWISATTAGGQGIALEFARPPATPGFGQLSDTRPVPSNCVGLGYDDVLGQFYGFSNALRPSPNGPVAVNGFEWSGYDFQPTGVEFCGDLNRPNVGGPRGGRAAGLDVYRRRVPQGQTSELRLACVVDASPATGQTRQYLYELAGPYRFGWSQLGRCGMRGGPPFLGSTTFQVTLSGVPDALFGICYLGFSNTVWNGFPLPVSLASAGWLESSLAISPDVSSALLAPTTAGEFVLPVNLPSTATLGYAEVFFQWFLLDPTVPGFLAGSQAGKTVLYP